MDPEYLVLVDAATLEPRESLGGEAMVAIAARVGTVRLIDNVLLSGQPADPIQVNGKAIATCSA